MPSFRPIAACLLIGIASWAAAARADPAPGGHQFRGGMPPMRVFTARDTNVKTMAWAAVQDAAGILYFGCDTVVSFDGDRWFPERMDPTYVVRGLDLGPNGRIWAAGVNQIGWFEAGPPGRLEYHSLMSRLPPGLADLGDVWRVYAEGDAGAVFVTHEKILRWDGNRFSAWEFPGLRMLWSTRTARAVYVHYPPLGLLRVGSEGPSLAVPQSAIGTADIRWLDDSGEDWLLLTSEGFKVLHQGACTLQDTEASRFARANTPTGAVRLADGSLAVGTLKGGIAWVGPGGALRCVFNQQTGLPANQVYSLFVDRDGALWAMGPSHIVRLAIESDVAMFGARNGYPPGGCESVAEYAGSIFVASHSDILRLSTDQTSGTAGQFTALEASSSRFYSLLARPEGLLVGHYFGLGLWSGSAFRPVLPSRDTVFRLSPSSARPGEVLASQYNQVLSLDPGTGRARVAADLLPDYGDSLAEEPSGRLWIGTASRGLFVAGPGTTRALPAAPRFGPLPTSGPALVSRAGPTVVVLAPGAAYCLDAKSSLFRSVPGFPEGMPSAISNPDAHGSVWAALDPDRGGHSPRLGRISVDDGRGTWTPQSIEGLSGLGTLLGLRVVDGGDGEALWILGSESLIRAGRVALERQVRLKPPLLRAWVRGASGRPERALAGVLPYSNAGLRLEFSSLDYGGRESERFQTRLSGVEDEWSAPSESAERDISGLREGSYEFQVRLLSDSGEAGEPAAVHFAIAPPWWRTPFAFAFLILGGAGLVLGAVRLRVRSLKRRALLLEEMVRQRTEELEKANAAKTDFVASMSHEIRNPMGGILGTALELAETPLGPEQRALVSTLRNCASFLASLVEDVLDFAAIEAGAYKVARSPLSPREVLGAVVKMLESRAGGAGMDAIVEPAVPEWILGDAARIQQVIVNFAANSLKFGARKVVLSARAEGGEIVFAVADDGAGIPLEEQKNLFIRFSRLKSARNSAIPGSGLGLAVCRALAERMGASVGLASAPGRGSTFFLRLPLEAAEAATPPSEPYHAQGARALVVEDLDYNARALGLMLGRLGFKVEFAADGPGALARLAADPYQAVFLDCDLPGLSGMEVSRRHRAAEAPGPRALIIATTAFSTIADQEACLAAGMDAFLSKPITPEKLRAVLAGAAGNGAPGIPGDPGAPAAEEPALELRMIRHLCDGSPASLRRELERFADSLDETLLEIADARASASRGRVASAAHRVLSHARMVGAAGLAATAADLQEYASVYTEKELAEEINRLGRQADALREALARHAGALPCPSP